MTGSDATEKGEHQNIARTRTILDALAESAGQGLRLTDVVRRTGLGKTSCHRALAGLVAHGLADQDEESGHFFLGLRLLGWAARSTRRYGLSRFIAPCLDRLAQMSEDTVYFSLLSGNEAVCVDRREGAYPIKTLTLGIGDRRPLGIGSGSLALLAAQPKERVETIIRTHTTERQRYAIDDVALRRKVKETQEVGYALIDGEIIPGMAAVGMALRDAQGRGIAALSVAAISQRMTTERRASIADLLQEEIARIECEAGAHLDSPLATLRT
ncbi:MAG: IclR family transcriptional regulator [Alphaproteobacteria bacterium]